jgi:FtsX-like permease family
MWARADLRTRWRSWVVLGLLAGVSAGIAAAAIAGARRTDTAISGYIRAGHVPDAAVLANDPSFDEAKRAAVAALPEVATSSPFLVPFELRVTSPAGMETSLIPVDERTASDFGGVIVAGRRPDPKRADEAVVNQAVRRQFGLDIGATFTVAQERGALGQTFRVVGITHSTDTEQDWFPSSAFYMQHRDVLAGPVNAFVMLRRGPDDFDAFHGGVERVLGRPVNVERGADLFGIEKIRDISRVERTGLLLFALSVVLGAGALVGQALVRAVSAGAANLPTWRSLGVDRATAVPAIVLPVLTTAVVAALTTVTIGIALSPRFPIAFTRRFDLDLGVHADWLVLTLSSIGVAAVVLLATWLTAEVRVRRGESERARPSVVAGAMTVDMPPPLLIGARLATEPGRGRRAVPVRSALVGAVVGVLGLVGCFTFRQGLTDTVDDASRSGVVWDYSIAAEGSVSSADRQTVVRDDAVDAVLAAKWARAVTIDGKGAPVFGTAPLKGFVDLIVTSGHAPGGPDELAVAPRTMRDLDLRIGEEVRVGPGPGRAMRVVGSALLPSTSHTGYDQSAWMTSEALASMVPPGVEPSDFFEDYLLVRWRAGTDVQLAQQRFQALGDGSYYQGPAALPEPVAALRELRALPFWLAVFFAVLGSATVAHALVTTVRRRGRDLAVLRSIGFTRRNARFAIAWQATLLTIAGLTLGVPLGIIVGRAAWKQLAEDFPVVYVPPLALLGVLAVAPVALFVANLLAAGPARAATRVRPAEVLRTE